MKKLTILTSVLALAACGGGSGGTHNNPGGASYPEIPASRVSSTVANSNSKVTGMDSSVTNIAEMTAAAEYAIGTDVLNNLSNNLDGISASVNRGASTRNAVLRSPHGYHSNKETFAYNWFEIGRMFHNIWGLEKRRQFYREQPDMVRGYGKIRCGCNDIDSYTEDQLLGLFDDPATRTNWDNFYNQNHYREYTLRDVDFTMSSASNGDEHGALDIVRFDLDENSKIIGVEFITLDSDEIGHEDTQNPDDDAYFTRSSDDSKVFNFVQDNIEGGVPTRLEGSATPQTYGGEHGTGNRYSDFGLFIVSADKYVNGVLTEQQENREPFAGGYNDKKIVNLPSETMNFTGKAVGGIQGKDGDGDLQVEADATLAFNGANQNQTLSMNFNDWYNVTIDKNLNSDKLTFTFDGTVANDNYALNGMGSGHKEVVIANPGNYNGTGYDDSAETKGKLQINYYGDNGNPEEFVGVVQYVETIEPANGSDVRMNISFGGIKDNP